MTTQFSIPDASCEHCKMTIERVVDGLDGVSSVELDLESKQLRVEHADVVTTNTIATAITDVGYAVEAKT